MLPTPRPEAVRRLRETFHALADRLRDVERLCQEADLLLEALEDGTGAKSPAPDHPRGPDALDARQGALLVALTVRGGTLDGPALTALAASRGVEPAAVEALFGGPEPRIVRRAGGAARLTEAGVDSAARWREVLPPDLLRSATAP